MNCMYCNRQTNRHVRCLACANLCDSLLQVDPQVIAAIIRDIFRDEVLLRILIGGLLK